MSDPMTWVFGPAWAAGRELLGSNSWGTWTIKYCLTSRNPAAGLDRTHQQKESRGVVHTASSFIMLSRELLHLEKAYYFSPN